jgi:hypothetical protein
MHHLRHGPASVASPTVIRYTRQVTIAWTLFFLASAGTSMFLYLFASTALWSAFTNLFYLPSLALMFIVEGLVRRKRLPPEERHGIIASVKAYVTASRRPPLTDPDLPPDLLMRQASCPLTDLPAPDSIIAWLPAGPVTRNQFLADVHQLAEGLPDGRHVLNICHNRYHFLVGLAAAIVRGKISLLPSSLTPNTVARLRQDTPDVFCLHDASLEDIDLPSVPFPAGHAPAEGTGGAGDPAEQIVAHVFTSGSTGAALIHRKTWGGLVINALSESERLGARGCTLVGTVPPQHVRLRIHRAHLPARWRRMLVRAPLLPGGHRRGPRRRSGPRALVTTPFHLRTLLEAGLALPPVDFLLSATAPLRRPRRRRGRLRRPLLEIYGCTETGQLASRRSTRPAPGSSSVKSPCATESGHAARGGHVEGTVPISDVIELGRAPLPAPPAADQVNIAGKRTSWPTSATPGDTRRERRGVLHARGRARRPRHASVRLRGGPRTHPPEPACRPAQPHRYGLPAAPAGVRRTPAP